MVLLGPPGSGKGTQAKKLEPRYGIPHISTGDILRQAISRGSDLGKEAAHHVERGHLVPDPLILDIVRERLLRSDCTPGYILDGFPRTLGQARGFDALLESIDCPLDAVVSLEVRLELFVKRLIARRVCPSCEAVYNLITTPPLREGICDRCGAQLTQRPDDVEETIQERFKIYKHETAEIKQFYEVQGIVLEVDGEGKVEEVHGRIVQALDRTRGRS